MDWTRGHFEQHQIDSARLTADLLLAHVLKAARVKLYMDFDRPLSKDELSTYKALIQRRLAGEPTQYLVGAKEFYGRRFSVDARVLIPRPETELLVEAALRELPSDRPIRVLDLCTGSGCIALTLAAERPRSSVWATDLSAGALVVARQNAEQLGLDGRVTFFEGDLCDPLPQQARFDLIVANPPYVRRGELATLQREVRREPTLALDGGDDGLEVLRRVLAQAAPRLNAGGLLALEIGEEQGAAVRELLVRAGYHDARIERDLERHDRLAFGRAPRPAPAQE
jgi:release factor glutamine methyltransferase